MEHAHNSAAKTIPILPARLDWPSAIGLFFINFGMLDYQIFEFLKNRLSPSEFAALRDKHFKDRLLRIAQCLKDENVPNELRVAFDRFTKRVEEIRELRNQIAHGFMFCRIDEQMQMILTICRTKDLYAEHLSESVRLEFHTLNEAVATLCMLIEEFRQLVG